MTATMHLAPGEVHIWRGSLVQPQEVVERLSRLLSNDERERAASFVLDAHRSRFIASRGIQRDVLARYVSVAAGELAFEYSPTGKPRLAGAAARSEVTFNVSNSGELSVFAVARGCAIGVDIEELRPLGDALTIADRFLAADELAAIETAPEQERAAVFLRCWTHFEARVKALGLSIGDRVEATPALASCALELGPSHVGTLAVEASALARIRYFDWMVSRSIGTWDPASEQRLD